MDYYSWSEKFEKPFNRIFEFQTKRSYIMMKKGPRSILKWKFLCFRRIIFWQLNTRIWHYSLLLNSSQILTFILSLGTFYAKILSDFIWVWLFRGEIFSDSKIIFIWALLGLLQKFSTRKSFYRVKPMRFHTFVFLTVLSHKIIPNDHFFQFFDKLNFFYY